MTPAALLAFINSIVGTKVISGQFAERGYAQGMDPITDIHTATGEWVGILGGDYYWFGSPGPADTNFNTAAIAHQAAGGIITISLTMPNPTTGGGGDDVSALNATDLLTGGTATNTAFKASLDQVAVGLAALGAAGVPVLFRPFHELNGTNWFWWNSTFQSNAQFIAMWRYVHDYYVITKGLTNLLWVYSVNAGYPITARYPGTAYVDTCGIDYYGDNPGPDLAADYVSLATLGKPMSITEFGAGSPGAGNLAFDERVLTTALATNMPNMFAWLQWWDANGASTGWGMSSVTQASAALATARVLNRDDLAGSVNTISAVGRATGGGDFTPDFGANFTTNPNIAVGAVFRLSAGTAAGTAQFTANFLAADFLTGAAGGSAYGVGAVSALSAGTAAGFSTAPGVAASTAAAVGTAYGGGEFGGAFGTDFITAPDIAVGLGLSSGTAVGTALGTSTAPGVGVATAASVGTASGGGDYTTDFTTTDFTTNPDIAVGVAVLIATQTRPFLVLIG